MNLLAPNQIDPVTQGILSAGFAALASSGYSRAPVSLGQVVGQAGMSGMGTYNEALNSLRKHTQAEALIDLEKKKGALLEEQIKAAQRKQQFLADYLARIGARSAAVPASPLAPVGLSDSSAQVLGAPWAAASELPQPQPPAQGQQPLISAEDVFALKMGAGVDFTDLFKHLNTPQNTPAGSYTRMPGGPMSYLPDPTKTPQHAGAVAGAEAAARLPFQAPTTINTAAGPRLMTPQQAIEFATGAAPQLPAQLPQPGAAPVPSVVIRQPAGAPGGALESEAVRTQKIEDAKTYGEIYRNLTKATLNNPGRIAKFERIGKLLADFEGGKLSNLSFELARLTNSLGISLDPRLGNKEAAEALSKEIALDLRNTAEGGGMPGAMSDADREFLRSMTPQMAQTASGRLQIIGARTALLRREMKVADMARAYKKRFNVLDEDFFTQLQAWSDRNPLFQ